MVFVEGDCRSLAYYNVSNLIAFAEDPSFTLEQVKTITKVNLLRMKGPEFLGTCGLKVLWKFVQMMDKALDSVKSKEEYLQLVNSLFRYVAVLHGWIHHYFPWYVGELFKQKTPEELSELNRLAATLKDKK